MIATHQIKSGYDGAGTRVAAWQYHKLADRPVWVARSFHDLGGGKLEAMGCGNEIIECNIGDWIVMSDFSIRVIGNSEFVGLFQSL